MISTRLLTPFGKGLLYKIHNLRINGRMFRWIRDFLSNRSFQVRVGLSLSSVFHLDEGIPQGSSLSPTLINIMINDVASHSRQHSKILLFADDVAVLTRCINVAHAGEKLQADIGLVEQWALIWWFKLLGDKSKFIILSLQKRMGDTLMVVNGTSLKVSSEVSFLGIVFDKGLTWSPHVKKLSARCVKGLNLLRCISGTE